MAGDGAGNFYPGRLPERTQDTAAIVKPACSSVAYLSSTSTNTNSWGFGFTTLCSTPSLRA
jgi:hypothetical protein